MVGKGFHQKFCTFLGEMEQEMGGRSLAITCGAFGDTLQLCEPLTRSHVFFTFESYLNGVQNKEGVWIYETFGQCPKENFFFLRIASRSAVKGFLSEVVQSKYEIVIFFYLELELCVAC